MTLDEIIFKLIEELDRAEEKHPVWPKDVLHASAIVGEEYGEFLKATVEVAYNENKATVEDMKKEAIQTGAMVIRFLMNLETYANIEME